MDNYSAKNIILIISMIISQKISINYKNNSKMKKKKIST